MASMTPNARIAPSVMGSATAAADFWGSGLLLLARGSVPFRGALLETRIQAGQGSPRAGKQLTR